MHDLVTRILIVEIRIFSLFLRLHKIVILQSFSRDSDVMHSFEKKSFLFDLLTRSLILIKRIAIKLILVIRRSFLERRILKMGN